MNEKIDRLLEFSLDESDNIIDLSTKSKLKKFIYNNLYDFAFNRPGKKDLKNISDKDIKSLADEARHIVYLYFQGPDRTTEDRLSRELYQDFADAMDNELKKRHQ